MNVLRLEKQAQILSALVEGNSVRSTSRMTGAHVGTILNLLVRVGNGCATFMDQTMHGLRCARLEVAKFGPMWGCSKNRLLRILSDAPSLAIFIHLWRST